MKILFLSHIYKSAHGMLVKNITEALKRRNYSVDHKPQALVAYDCILVFNRKTFEKYKNTLRGQQLPVIYLHCLSDIAEEYMIVNVVTQTIVFKDIVLNTNHLFSASVLYQEMMFSADIPTKSTQQSEKPRMYIRIENNHLDEITFLKLLPLLNSMNEYNIHYQSVYSLGRHLLNPHIRIISGAQDIQNQIRQADTVIGSGITAAFAVQQGKRTIVVGERGYGGLVVSKNLEYHTSNCFQGRNGGKLDEIIPLELVRKACISEEFDSRENMEQFSLIQIRNENKIIKKIEEIVQIYNRIHLKDSTLNYLLNPDYNIFKRKKRIWLYKKNLGTLYKSINSSESVVIRSFQQPHSILEVLNAFPPEYKEDIKQYIQELITEKILIPADIVHLNSII